MYGTPRNFKFTDWNHRVVLGGKAVWCDALNDNLLSVGRLCDSGFSVTFTRHGCCVYVGDNFRGKPIQQPRDPATGLYPIYLVQNFEGDCRPMKLPGGSREANGTPVSMTSFSVSIEDVRKHFGQLTEWARSKITEGRGAKEGPRLQIKFKNFEERKTQGLLARFYVPSNVSNFERWHAKLGHPGKKILMRCRIPGLVIPKILPRCDACTKGKMHKLGPTGTPVTETREIYKPGEYIMTDLQGPYVGSRNGAKYSQIFVDLVSMRVWTVGLSDKTGSDEAIRKVLVDARSRSGRPIKILRTDGDGIFGRSSTFQKLKEEFNFVHERPAPYDHKKSAVIDRECRTLLEGTSTLLSQSGAPPSFWEEANTYFVFVRNRLPRFESEKVGVFVSSEEKLRGIVKPFSLNNSVPFGAQVNCLIPKEKRGKKTPGQAKSFQGAIVGIAEDCSAYRVWDFEARKVREVSFSFCVVSEGCFPFRGREVGEKESLPFFLLSRHF